MERIVIETEIAASREAVFDWVADFPRYVESTRHIAGVERLSEDPVRYAVTGRWRSIEHTVTSRVTTFDPPTAIGWDLEGSLEAHGRWELESLEDTPQDRTAVRTTVTYDLNSVRGIGIGLPPMVSFFGIREKVHDVITAEVRRVIDAATSELEAEPTDPNLEVDVVTDP